MGCLYKTPSVLNMGLPVANKDAFSGISTNIDTLTVDYVVCHGYNVYPTHNPKVVGSNPTTAAKVIKGTDL